MMITEAALYLAVIIASQSVAFFSRNRPASLANIGLGIAWLLSLMTVKPDSGWLSTQWGVFAVDVLLAGYFFYILTRWPQLWVMVTLAAQLVILGVHGVTIFGPGLWRSAYAVALNGANWLVALSILGGTVQTFIRRNTSQ